MSLTFDSVKKRFLASSPAAQYAMTIGSAGAAALGALAIMYPDRAIFDEKREDIPQRHGYPLIGSLPDLLSNMDSFHHFALKGFETVGVTTTMSNLGIPRNVATSDPRCVEHILKNNFLNYEKGPQFRDGMDALFGHGIFNTNGDEWKFQRKTASQIFNVKNFRDHFTDVFVDELQYMKSAILDPLVENGNSVDFHDLMFKFTLDSFVIIGFGEDLGALRTEGKVPFAAAFDAAQVNTFRRMMVPYWRAREGLAKILMPWAPSMDDHIKVVNAYAADMISKRRQDIEAGQEHNDLLSRFLKSRDDQGNLLNDTQLRDIILNFIIAGRDTTAQALSWAMYELMLNPEIEEKLAQEIFANISDEDEKNSPALYEIIKDMKYAHAVFYETLRLHPSVPANQKYALEDDIWPDGTVIKKGDYVVWSPWCQGRLESIWGPDAKEFKPERWFNENSELKRENQGVWPAFHAGPRVCLGQNLATLEALVALTMLMKRYRFKLLPGQNITYQISLTLPMKYGMKVQVNQREKPEVIA
ncbi:cytochrome P450 [Umbelopsis sp. PMI_123]|nr:cytochrome P450 [Umbelopsis sp. PMI_123]